VALVAGASGALAATALPPLGIWPLGVIGFGAYYLGLRHHRAAGRAATGLCFGLGYFALGLAFLADFSLTGYVLLVVGEAAFLALAAVLTVPEPGRATRFVAALVLVEWVRDRVPFGGLPIASPALGQAAGPLAALARLGGPLLVGGVTSGFGVALVELTRPRGTDCTVCPRAGLQMRLAPPIGIAALVLVAMAGALAPAGHASRRTVAFAAVQGGGPRGYPTTPELTGAAFLRTLSSSSELVRPHGLVFWPEDTVPLDTGAPGAVPDTVLDQLLRDEAQRLDATLLVGATERVGRSQFRNEMLEFSSTGQLLARYEKEHPVPFGEYLQLRACSAISCAVRRSRSTRSPGTASASSSPRSASSASPSRSRPSSS
jgi:apolipoprotein N-acyltransferase